MPDVRTRRPLAIASVVCALALAGCQDNLARRDSIVPWAGDDIAANEAIQTVNPWPRYAFDDGLTVQGSKVEDAMKIYRLPPAPPTAAPVTTEAAVSAPTPMTGAASPGSN